MTQTPLRILVAEDDPGTQLMLQASLRELGHEVELVADGLEALAQFQAAAFDIVLSDWMMPGMAGPELCQRIRALPDRPYAYLMMLTSRDTPADLLRGTASGADSYMTKPVAAETLCAHVIAAGRIISLERSLATRIEELQRALQEVKTLRGLLPICMYCHRIRDDDEAWSRIEEYLAAHTDIDISHGICPTCYESKVTPMLEEYRAEHDAA